MAKIPSILYFVNSSFITELTEPRQANSEAPAATRSGTALNRCQMAFLGSFETRLRTIIRMSRFVG